ncbi:MAG: hypothetical protein M3P49_17275 [Actinomycetota bacterium]|nr:hypothetical protein [Actinomycetota bacterium]
MDSAQVSQEMAENGLEAARVQIAQAPQIALYDDDGDEAGCARASAPVGGHDGEA